MTDIDLLAIVTRPDFPSGDGPIGDHMGLEGFAAERPHLNVRTVVLNASETRLHVEVARVTLAQGEAPPIELSRVRLVLYMPVCLEVEETDLAVLPASEPYPLFAARQWRPITDYLEHLLPRTARCLNTPRATRLANNKLIQIETLAGAGIALPATCVSTGFPRQGALAGRTRLVRKNISEGGWKSPTRFSPARLVGADEPNDAMPAIWQAPLEADHEYRCYVMGEEVSFVRLERDRAVTDVRATHGGRPRALIVEGDGEWSALMLAAARALSLDYAVIDAMPFGDDLTILEVNANGVWWFLPKAVQDELKARFHAYLDRLISEARQRSSEA